MGKEIKIVTLEGDTIDEIEAKATAAVNEGGTIIGSGGFVMIEGDPIPALIICRKKAEEAVDDEDNDDVGTSTGY